MNHPVGNLIFDFDGTLADTSRLIVATMQDAIGKLRLPLAPKRSAGLL